VARRRRQRSPRSRSRFDVWPSYVTVAERRSAAARDVARATNAGTAYRPVVVSGRRKIALTTWGQAWCEHIESFHDFSNRLPRGRTYVRHGAVVDLQIRRGEVRALVRGSEMYESAIDIAPCKPVVWKRVRRRASSGVGSLIELLEGRLSESVMSEIVAEKGGLLPDLRQVTLDCSCPDWARLCKHLAAVLYGIGARLDQEPELLFTLRGVEPGDLVSSPAPPATGAPPARANRLEGDLSVVFGIELADTDPPTRRRPKAAKRPATGRKRKRPRSGAFVKRAELLEIGVPAGTVGTWLHQGVLAGTDRRGVYRHTAESSRRLRERERARSSPAS